MPDFPSLQHAPCVEAIIELRTSLVAPAPLTVGRDFASRLVADFPHAQDLHFLTTQIHVGRGDVPATGSSTLIGARLESADHKWVIQAKLDALSVSRLVPYTGWPELRSMFEKLWLIYCEMFAPSSVTRLGVRFLNRIAIGSDSVDLDTFFTAGPKVPPLLPQILLAHQSHIVVPLQPLGAAVSIGMTSDVLVDQDGNPAQGVLIDIDAFSDGPRLPNDAKIWGQLENLREAKNLAFFGSLHPAMLARFK